MTKTIFHDEDHFYRIKALMEEELNGLLPAFVRLYEAGRRFEERRRK